MSYRYSEVEQAGHWVRCNFCAAPVPPAAKARRWDTDMGYVYCNRNCQAQALRMFSPNPRPSANANAYGVGPNALSLIVGAYDLVIWYGVYGAPYLLPHEEMPAGGDLQGAYVQAWVWVDLNPVDGQIDDDTIRARARACWQEDGEIEIDDDAHVSRSYTDG